MAIEILKTWDFLEQFIQHHHIEAEVFAAKGWNRSSNQLLFDSSIYDDKKKQWMRKAEASKGKTSAPTGWELYQAFKNRVSIQQDKQTGILRLSVEYYSPILAQQWAQQLVQSINAHFQKQDRITATNSIMYLKQKVDETHIAGMQSVFYQLIEEQTKTLMLAEVSDEYVFKTISPAKVAEEKIKPKRALIVVLGLLLGLMFSVMGVLIRHFKKTSITR
jgi:uncharacterized protein involved in exopolysaccharide biosynthesis